MRYRKHRRRGDQGQQGGEGQTRYDGLESGTQKLESILPYSIVRLTKSILRLLASGNRPKTVVTVVSTTGSQALRTGSDNQFYIVHIWVFISYLVVGVD